MPFAYDYSPDPTSKSIKPTRILYTHQSSTMSAPNAGRQSPEPEKQSDGQVGAPESGKIDAAPSETHAKDASEDHKQNALESNPTGPLEDAAHEKVSKEGRGNV